jgi:ribonuclease HIII
VISIHPERYNELHAKFGNLNRLLAWGHARVIENLLERVPDCPRAISDQFANPAVLQRSFQKRGREPSNSCSEPRRKADPAVAAASILAREAFVRWLKSEGQKIGIEFPKGASAQVKTTAASLVKQHGDGVLRSHCKMHFRTSSEVLSGSVSDCHE